MRYLALALLLTGCFDIYPTHHTRPDLPPTPQSLHQMAVERYRVAFGNLRAEWGLKGLSTIDMDGVEAHGAPMLADDVTKQVSMMFSYADAIAALRAQGSADGLSVKDMRGVETEVTR